MVCVTLNRRCTGTPSTMWMGVSGGCYRYMQDLLTKNMALVPSGPQCSVSIAVGVNNSLPRLASRPAVRILHILSKCQQWNFIVNMLT